MLSTQLTQSIKFGSTRMPMPVTMENWADHAAELPAPDDDVIMIGEEGHWGKGQNDSGPSGRTHAGLTPEMAKMGQQVEQLTNMVGICCRKLILRLSYLNPIHVYTTLYMKTNKPCKTPENGW